MKKIAILICLLVGVLPETLMAQKIQKVSGEYTYYAPSNVTLDQAKHIALEQAKIQLIADEFGTVIGNTNIIRTENKNGLSDVQMISLGQTEVKGEWLETIGDPEYEVGYKNDMLFVKVTVAGRIREILTASIDIKTKVLRNGTEDRFQSNEFKDGDEMYLSFHTPVDGYLTVYLYDGDNNVFCLLPYQSQEAGQISVKAHKPYVFFSGKHSEDIQSYLVDEYVLTCSKEMEFNRLYVIFSPNRYTKASDSQSDEVNVPRYLEFKDFQQWLSKCRVHDLDMTLRIEDITITK